MPLGQAWLGPTCGVRGTSRVGPLSIDAAGGRARLWRLHFLWLIMIWHNLPVLANAKTDKPEHQQAAPATIIQSGYSIAESMLIRAPTARRGTYGAANKARTRLPS